LLKAAKTLHTKSYLEEELKYLKLLEQKLEEFLQKPRSSPFEDVVEVLIEE